MTDRMTIDSSGSVPHQDPVSDEPPCATARHPSSTQPASVKKARRPRPTFEDGALTRVFKFPSKAYPRSSYYVTSTEIIIRIKKARKKWKLTIPKKRVVSYRTNRWFAKPRWVAIELTYTQAVKLGLTEARPRSPEVQDAAAATAAAHAGRAPSPAASDNPAVEAASPLLPLVNSDATGPAASQAMPATHAVEDDHGEQDLIAPGNPVVLSDDDIAATLDDPHEDVDQVEFLAEQEGAEHFELALDTDEPEADEPDIDEAYSDEPQAAVLPHPPTLVVADAPPVAKTSQAEQARDEPDAQILPFVPPPQPPKAAPRRGLRHAVATLAAAVAGYALWAAIEPMSAPPVPDCVRAEAEVDCGHPIVTGAIGPASTPQPPEDTAAGEPPLTPSDIAAVARMELDAQTRAEAGLVAITQEPLEIAGASDASREAMGVVLPERHLVLPLPPPVFTASVEVPQPIATAPPACDTLEATGRGIQINFDYARSNLAAETLPALDAFATLLRACPESRAVIEGHTDTDGRAANNRSLSLRRAQAVLKHLVAAGVAPDQVDAVGFGQTRPLLPNVSQRNKRSNRRVVLVVTAPR